MNVHERTKAHGKGISDVVNFSTTLEFVIAGFNCINSAVSGAAPPKVFEKTNINR